MSTAKLRINKFEDGSNFKSIYITIPDDDNSPNIEISKWTEGMILPKKKGSEKSSRLVVKIISGEESRKIELDSCSKEIADSSDNQTHLNIRSHVSAPNGSSAEFSVIPESNNHAVIHYEPYEVKCASTFEEKAENLVQGYDLDLSNPLEHSLQKVKENNARIMENINKLNRTLNYTKKKEILDIICPKSMRTYPCNACGKCFVYETGLRRHYAMRHVISEMQPRWQVVWTCIQCFQVWPRQDQALEHSIECCKSQTEIPNQETVREIKTSLLLQCEYCEKVYTSIPRLLRHSKIHTTASNYECNSCRLAFVSYKLVEQHWPLCPWLNASYCFSLPKMLLCNACDRKFKNYEQLYNHRYKVGHFMTKTHITADRVKPLGMLVYQCELCPLWHNSIPHMISHRSQHHPNDDPSIYTKMDIAITNEISDNNYMPDETKYYMN